MSPSGFIAFKETSLTSLRPCSRYPLSEPNVLCS